MLDQPYKFRKASKTKDLSRPFIHWVLTYVFQLDDVIDKKIIYIVEVEVYDHDIHVVKYYQKCMKGDRMRFNILTNEMKASRIIATCLAIIFDVIKRRPSANIGFLASRTQRSDGSYEEGLRMTKRFRIYKQAFQDFFGPATFSHYPDANTSTYLLINNRNNIEVVKKCAETMFSTLYPTLFAH